MIVLHTLGDALIVVGERKVRPSSPLVFASLLFLAMERGRRVPRAALQEMFFPNSDERSGAHSLRQLLYKLRRLGTPLESDPTTVSLPADRVQDDASNGALASGLVDFLPDYHPAISDRFSEWLDRKRAETAKAVRTQLLSAIASHREVLNWPAVERDAQLLLHIDAFNEVATYALAEAAAMTGRKAAAIKILSDYERETGRTDLRLPASLLRRRILQTVPEQVATLSPLPFVGRDVEVKELRKHIARARAGQPCMYVIGGEAGIGKTRLLTETAALAALEGVAVFTVRCQSHYASRPFSVFIELVPALLAAPGALGVSPQSLAALTSLTRHMDEQPRGANEPHGDVTRSELLLTAIRDLADAVVSEQPVLIAVEDAHWADVHSLRELNRLVQGAIGRALIIVCTTRTVETFPHRASIDDYTLIRRLRPISKEAMDTLAATLLPAQAAATSGLLEWSVTTAGGNPLFLQMLCSHYSTTREAFSVPSDVTSAVTRRVQQLTNQQRRILALCALLGKHASLSLLHSVVGRDHFHLLQAIQPLEEAGYLLLSEDCLRIAHDLLGQATLSLLPPVSRRLLHGSVATALENAYEVTNDASVLWDCAAHWEQSGDSSKAVEFLIRCARHAIRIGRASEALQLLARAEKSAHSLAEVIEVLRESLLASRAASEWQLTKEYARRLLELRPDVLGHSPYEFAVFQAFWNTSLLGNDSVGRLRRCVVASDASVAHRIDAAHLLICIAHESGNAQLATDAFAAISEVLDPSIGTSTNRTIAAIYEMAFGDVNRARLLVYDALSSSWRFDSVADELRAALNSTSVLVMSGANERAIDIATTYLAKCEALGLQSWRTEFQAVLCMIHCIQEDFVSVERWLSILDSQGIRLENSCALLILACRIELCIDRQDFENAGKLLSSPEITNVGDSIRGRAYFKSLDVRSRQVVPQYQTDDETLAELRQLYRQTRHLSCADSTVMAYAEALRRRGKADEMQALLSDYSMIRRELGPLCPGLLRFIGAYGVSNSGSAATLTTSVESALAASTAQQFGLQ